MKHADLKEGMKIRATCDYADSCWKTGDEFIVHMEIGEGHAPLPFIECHDTENGPQHLLDALDEGDGELPEFEPTP